MISKKKYNPMYSWEKVRSSCYSRYCIQTNYIRKYTFPFTPVIVKTKLFLRIDWQHHVFPNTIFNVSQLENQNKKNTQSLLFFYISK